MKSFKRFLVEKIIKKEPEIDVSKYLQSTGKKDFSLVDDVHNHPDIKPQNITADDHEAIDRYTLGSPVTNSFLDKKYLGEKTERTKANIETVKNLSKIFTPENTNKKPIISYSGVPPFIGEKLLNAENNSKHILPRFTSSSTEKPVAIEFAKKRAKQNNKRTLHILKLYSEPNSNISVVDYSSHRPENELVTHHGAHITLLGSTKENIKNNPAYIHHIIVHNTHTPLKYYGKTL